LPLRGLLFDHPSHLDEHRLVGLIVCEGPGIGVVRARVIAFGFEQIAARGEHQRGHLHGAQQP